MRSLRLLLLKFLFLSVIAAKGFAAPVVDSIRYNEVDQSILIVYLSEDVTYTASFPAADPDWIVYNGGVAYPSVATQSRFPLDPGNIIRMKLPSAITYSEATAGITVSTICDPRIALERLSVG